MDNKKEDKNELVAFLSESGFKLVSIKTIVDALAEMETYMMKKLGINEIELEYYIRKVEELVGEQEAVELEIDESINWIETLRSL
jgi:tRNA U34 5-carboxymethylaminomethyl modifying enzyme MnmG/GidA